MNWILDLALKTRTPLRAAADASKRAARWSRLRVGALASVLVILWLANQFAAVALLHVSVALSAGAVFLNTIAAGSHGGACLASRRAVKASRRYADARLQQRTFTGLILAWIAQVLAMLAVPLAGLACAVPILWMLVMAAFAGCVVIAVNATQRMFALVDEDIADDEFSIEA